jgi:uncharacterized SAM-binding protein YcdF (DUF218 family)
VVWLLVIVELAVLVWAVYIVRAEPRRALNAPLIGLGALAALGSVGVGSSPAPVATGMAIAMISAPLWVSGLVLALLASGFKMLARGGRSIGDLLGGLTGLALIGVVLVGFWLITLNGRWSLALGVWLLLAASWLGFLFMSMVIYQWFYSVISARRPPDFIVALGAGLADGKVGRVLASRVRKAAQIGSSWQSRGHSPVLVMSGGQGSDEPRPEAAAMAEYAIDDLRVPGELVLLEDASTNTEENLRYTAKLVEADPRLGPEATGLAVTSNFHVLRTADLARRLGLPIQVAGAPVSWYYWPAGMVREFVAELVNHKWPVLISTVLLTIALPIVLVALN